MSRFGENFGETVTVTRKGTPTGGYGADGGALFTADSTFPILRVAAAPQGSTETADSPGVYVVTGYELYLPADTILLASDRLTIRGVAGWQVQGESVAATWRNPFDGVARGVAVSVMRSS